MLTYLLRDYNPSAASESAVHVPGIFIWTWPLLIPNSEAIYHSDRVSPALSPPHSLLACQPSHSSGLTFCPTSAFLCSALLSSAASSQSPYLLQAANLHLLPCQTRLPAYSLLCASVYSFPICLTSSTVFFLSHLCLPSPCHYLGSLCCCCSSYPSFSSALLPF